MFVFRMMSGTRVVDVRKSARVIGIILVASALVFVNTSYGYPLAFEIAPVALALGTVLGFIVMRSVRFWRDDQTGELWMDADKTFLVVWGILVGVRIVVAIVSAATASGPERTQQAGWVALSSAFLVASMGLWIARGAVIYRLYRRAQ
jgi:hypothetical protein